MFHITRVYLGDHVLLKPYIPSNPMDDEDTGTKRICVAPDVINCIVGKAGRVELETVLGGGSSIFVYRSSSQDYVVADTPDQTIFKEHWYLSPTLFKYVGTIHLDSEGVIQVNRDVELHRRLMVPHHINYFNGLLTHRQLMDLWREEAIASME